MTITNPIVPPLVAMALVELADCVCEQLATAGAGPTCWCGVYPGAEVAWDYCGECNGGHCGMGWVRLRAVFPYDIFPTGIDRLPLQETDGLVGRGRGAALSADHHRRRCCRPRRR